MSARAVAAGAIRVLAVGIGVALLAAVLVAGCRLGPAARHALNFGFDGVQRADFLDAADRQLTGHRWHPDVSPDRYEYIRRQRILFATEIDAHARRRKALRLPVVPDGADRREDAIHRVRIAPGPC